MKGLLRNENGNIEIVQASIYLIVVLVILYIGLSISQNVISGTSLDDSVEATGVVTLTGVTVESETLNISTEIYTFRATPVAAFDVDIGTNATVSMQNLITEITANSTLLTASSEAGVGTVTAVVVGDAGNDYVFVTNTSNGSVDAATLTGGVDGDEMYDASVEMHGVSESSYNMAGILPIVMIAVAILGTLLGVVYMFR